MRMMGSCLSLDPGSTSEGLQHWWGSWGTATAGGTTEEELGGAFWYPSAQLYHVGDSPEGQGVIWVSGSLGLSDPSQPNPATLAFLLPLVSNLSSHTMWPPLRSAVSPGGSLPFSSLLQGPCPCLSPSPNFTDLKRNPYREMISRRDILQVDAPFSPKAGQNVGFWLGTPRCGVVSVVPLSQSSPGTCCELSCAWKFPVTGVTT